MKKILLVVCFLLMTCLVNASELTRLHVFDARTNTPVTATTQEVNIFLELTNSVELQYQGRPVSLRIDSFEVADLHNARGVMQVIKAGAIDNNNYATITLSKGSQIISLGRFSVAPETGRYFKGGMILRFTFNNNRNVDSPFVSASEVISFSIPCGNCSIK